MIRKLFFIAASILVITSCVNEVDNANSLQLQAGEDDEVFYATLEGSPDAGTKVYADSKMRTLWNADDRVSIFRKTTGNEQYRFTGEDGANAGNFSHVSGSKSQTALNYFYSLYPYSEATSLSADGVVSLTMPAEQVYKENSFGIGANTMLSVTANNQLKFRNVGSFLSFKFYGNSVFVKSITLKGNNHEKLAGAATVSMALNGTPLIKMADEATESITLNCETAVAISSDKNSATVFWFVLPPTDFTKGITVTVLDDKDGVFVMNSAAHLTFERNKLTSLSAKKVVPVVQYIAFEDAKFKTYCVAHFDTDGDGEVSLAEGLAVTEILVGTDTIASVKGIECFPNLTSLHCYGSFTYTPQAFIPNGQLTQLDVSHNTALQSLWCHFNHLAVLDVSQNTAMTELVCSDNDLTGINLENNPALKYLSVAANKIKNLDLSHNLKLERIDCTENPISSLDVTQNTELEQFAAQVCPSLTSLDLSMNMKLQYINVLGSPLTSIQLPVTLTSISRDAFGDCQFLTFNIPSRVKTVGDNAFSNCTKLFAVTVPASVTSLGSYVFNGCTSLGALYMAGSTPPTIGTGLIDVLPQCICWIYVPEDAVEAYKNAPGWSAYADRIKTGESGPYESTDYSADGKVHVLQTATIGKGIDVVLMGDAYSDRMIADGTYGTIMQKTMDAFFVEEPFASFKECFNVYYVDVVSKNEVYNGETALETYYGHGTLVGGNKTTVLKYAKEVISEDRMDDALIVVAMNRDYYAGTCYLSSPMNGDYGRGLSIAFFPTDISANYINGVVAHEACGHGFAKLADEYQYAIGAIPDNDRDGYKRDQPYGWFKNVDFTSDPTKVLWAHFLADPRYDNEQLGVYEGGCTYQYGVWRPSDNSIMVYNTGGFNAPSREAIWIRIHKLAYGPEWEYNYEDFVAFDTVNRNAVASQAVQRDYVTRPLPPLAPPVIIPGDWRAFMEDGIDN